jgi:hypothetical protein
MFDLQFCLDLVNSEYAADLQRPIAPGDLTSSHPRVLRRIEECLKVQPLKFGTFNHYRSARYLEESFAVLLGKIDPLTLGRVEDAFKALNPLL